jgi:hypothetical protein
MGLLPVVTIHTGESRSIAAPGQAQDVAVAFIHEAGDSVMGRDALDNGGAVDVVLVARFAGDPGGWL